MNIKLTYKPTDEQRKKNRKKSARRHSNNSLIQENVILGKNFKGKNVLKPKMYFVCIRLFKDYLWY